MEVVLFLDLKVEKSKEIKIQPMMSKIDAREFAREERQQRDNNKRSKNNNTNDQ
jgi:hypothetical protein